ncbi:NVEALA domain-containing protein [Bacteroides fragilis]|uniref:NVEALA domain-containing protein n=1 Tax=Bacteroides hominis TaxID=2763023 RepID=UPI0022931DB0|nr:NVEALA domain-containing protein [Bacteroides fragilis]
MKKYLKAIGCFAIFVLAVFLYFREQPYKLDSLSLQNVEALAEGEEYTHISCISVGSLDCPVNHSGVKYIFKGY